MQTAMHFNAKAVFLLALIGNGIVADAYSLRRSAKQPPSGAIALSSKVHDEIDYEVIEKQSIKRDNSTDCLCEMGMFWHWRIKQCIKQGPWGYECGFFPEEHHRMVCQDGLHCEELKDTKVKYQWHSKGAAPASCQHCEAEDKCLSGEERHEESCLKEYKLSGDACQTVRVTVKASASAKVTEKVTESATKTATATASATEKAEVNVDGKTAAAEKTATADGKATVTAEATGKSTAKATATEDGTAEGKACVTIDEVKKVLGLKDVARIGAVLSANVVSKGDEMAFDRAYEKALEAAQKAGLMNAEEAAKALAAAEAREKAANDARAKAEEAAAWKAEAGADKDAQENAKDKALGDAQAAAAAEAQAAADAAAKAAAAAEAAEKAAEDAEARAAQDAADARKKADEARAAAEAAAKAAEEAKARNEAISDVINPKPTEAPIKPTTPQPTNPPRKITAKEQQAKMP